MKLQGYKKKHEYISQFGVKSVVYLMDCMEAMQQMQFDENCLAVVDPPYSETFNTDACADNKGKKGKYKLETLNNHLPTDEYWEQLFRVSKNQIVWGANWYGKYFGVGGLVWFKDNTGNYSPCEYAYQSINNHIHHYQYRWNGMLQQNMKNKEERIHPTQKPVALYDWIFKNYARPTDWILDTHLGSGSSRIASHRAGLAFVGFELDEEYFDKSAKRFEEYVSQPTIFDIEPELEKYEQLKIE
jgi:site-specific DNA-methyltransferase (adenine-specific)